MSDRLLQNAKFQSGITPSADIFAGDGATDVYNMRDFKHILFILHTGTAVGTTVITVESCDNVTPDTKTAIAFRYKKVTTPDVESDTTQATTAGFTTTATGPDLYMIEVDDSELSGTDQYVRLKTDEVDSTATIGSIIAIQTGAKFAGDDLRTAIV